MTLCFLPAAQAKKAGSITEVEYIHQLLSHLLGLEHLHDGDDYPEPWPPQDEDLLELDPFACSVKRWVMRAVPNPVKGKPVLSSETYITNYFAIDITPLEAVFAAYRVGNIDDLKAKMSLLTEQQAKDVCNSLTVLAILERRADLLKYFFSLGYVVNDSLELVADQAQDAGDDAQICKIIEESEFRSQFPRLPPRGQRIGADESKDYDPAEVFDRGGEYDVGW
jgi:hypothetical protein